MKVLLYGGKGGVGKTTCAAARAVAEAAAGRTVVVVSTDPAHSLGDVLNVRLSSTPRLVGPRLRAMELDAPRAFGRWLTQHRRALGDIIEQGTWLDRDDVRALLDLSIPGVDELVGLLEISRLARTPGVDCIVVDSAPTGHMLRMLAAPRTVDAVATALDTLHETHRIIRDQIARVGGPEASDRLIALLADQSREMGEMLRDPDRAAVHWVTLAEDLSLAETTDALAALAASRFEVREIVVNRVLPDGEACRVCDPRRARERRVIAKIRRGAGRHRDVRIVHAGVREPRGVRALARLFAAPARERPPGAGALNPSPLEPVAAESLDAIGGACLLFFLGKGGVGKTTVAAGTAVRVAYAQPRSRVLLLSTDPAHSLGDVFDRAVSDEPGPLPGGPSNLHVREIDARRAFARRRAAIEAALDEMASAVGAGTVMDGGGRASEMFDLAPPGMDELFGLLSILDARDRYDRIIVDSAPTGHALRLLEMPETVRDWVQVFLRVLLKYRAVVRPGGFAAELVELSKSIRTLHDWLRDRNETRMIVVTRAAGVTFAETERLLARLRRMKLKAAAIIVNARTLAPGRCRRCRAVALEERRWLEEHRRGSTRQSRGCAIIQTPLSVPPPRGTRMLRAWAGRWIANG